MISFSTWSFNNDYTFEDIIHKINKENTRRVSDRLTISSTNILNCDNNNYLSLNILGKNTKCIFVKLLPNDLNQSVSDIDVLIYEFDNKIRINAFRGFSTANKILRQFFTEASWGKINPEKSDVNEDLLYWMFKLIIDKSTNTPLEPDNKLYINSLKRYRGSSKDQGNNFTGEGDRISDILGTLAFLLDNDVKLLKTRIIYHTPDVFHSLVLEIKLTGTLKFDTNYYDGQFKSLNNTSELTIALSILITEFIIPILIDSYKYAITNHKWNPSLKRDFIERIGDKIKERVDNEIHKVTKSIQQISMSTDIDNNELDDAAIDSEFDEFDEFDDMQDIDE